MTKRIYLDYNATTPVLEPAKAAYIQALDHYGNPSSLHQEGQTTKIALENARASIASHLDISAERLVFTSSGTESNATVFYGLALPKLCKGEPVHIITSTTEHSSVLDTCKYLSKLGAEITYLPCDSNGRIDSDNLSAKIKPSTILISILLANNETGVIQDLAPIVEIATHHRIPLHTDATQAIGKMPVSITELGVDYASFSSHKLYAPKGVGGLIIKEKDTLPALLRGGGQEKKYRSGTENIPGILSLEAACNALFSDLDGHLIRLKSLKESFIKGLDALKTPIRYHGNTKQTLANTLNLAFPGISGEALMMNLDLEGISIATGSACSTGSIEPSHVLQAMGKTDSESLEAIRISLGLNTTSEEVQQTIHQLSTFITQI